MNDTPPPKTGVAGRYVLIALCAAIGFTVALVVAALLPINEDRTLGLAYPAVFVVAAASITLIFRRFVMRQS